MIGALALQQVSGILSGYAERGMFRGFAALPSAGSKQTFHILWHYNRQYPLVLDLAAATVSFRGLLPAVPARSPMLKALREFLRPFATAEVPAHRRIDENAGVLKMTVREGDVTLLMDVKDGQYEYCTRKLVHIAHEIFMVFLWDGPYFDYRVEHLGLDPDAAWP
jgi:hypothetical protein